MKTILNVWLVMGLCLAAAASSPAAQSESALPLTIVNYSRLPVYATAVTLDEKDIAGRLGLPAGTPLRVRSADKAAAIPLTRGTE
jgi:hypothetical protein